jgi:hypothetical protein
MADDFGGAPLAGNSMLGQASPRNIFKRTDHLFVSG